MSGTIRMDLLESLPDYFSLHDLTEKEIIRLGTDILRGLEFCPFQGILHWDIKPDTGTSTVTETDSGSSASDSEEKSLISPPLSGVFDVQMDHYEDLPDGSLRICFALRNGTDREQVCEALRIFVSGEKGEMEYTPDEKLYFAVPAGDTLQLPKYIELTHEDLEPVGSVKEIRLELP